MDYLGHLIFSRGLQGHAQWCSGDPAVLMGPCDAGEGANMALQLPKRTKRCISHGSHTACWPPWPLFSVSWAPGTYLGYGCRADLRGLPPVHSLQLHPNCEEMAPKVSMVLRGHGLVRGRPNQASHLRGPELLGSWRLAGSNKTSLHTHVHTHANKFTHTHASTHWYTHTHTHVHMDTHTSTHISNHS